MRELTVHESSPFTVLCESDSRELVESVERLCSKFSLEKLLMDNCNCLSTLRISSSSLEFLDIVICDGETFHVEAMNLESFKFCGLHDIKPLVVWDN